MNNAVAQWSVSPDISVNEPFSIRRASDGLHPRRP